MAFGLGANLGDRQAAMQQSIDQICAGSGITPVAVSAIVETDPVGGPEQPDYLNAVLVVDSDLAPSELLRLAQAAEVSAGRIREIRWGPRTLDVDLLAVGELISADPNLTLPHPRAHERGFVLLPWAEVDPSASLPGHGLVEALARVVDIRGVRGRPDLSLRLPAVPAGT